MLSKTLSRRYFGAYVSKRNPTFTTLTDADIQTFEGMLGKKGLVTDVDELDSYNTDWTKKHTGQSKLLLRPGTTEETAEVLKYCNHRKLAVVPQGGKTGLVGGNVPVFDEVIV